LEKAGKTHMQKLAKQECMDLFIHDRPVVEDKLDMTDFIEDWLPKPVFFLILLNSPFLITTYFLGITAIFSPTTPADFIISA
jgi:hypothetical protein